MSMRLLLLGTLLAPALLARADHPILTEDADVPRHGDERAWLFGAKLRW